MEDTLLNSIVRSTNQFFEMIADKWKATTLLGRVTVLPLMFIGLLFILLVSYIMLTGNRCYTNSDLLKKLFLK